MEFLMTSSKRVEWWEDEIIVDQNWKRYLRSWSSAPLQFLFKCLVIVVALALAPELGEAQTLPSPIRFIVPFAPGGPVDFTARVLANKMESDLGITVIIENRAGANGIVAAMYVKQAAPDGRTLLFTSSGTMTISPNLDSKIGYNPLTDFTPITMVAYADAVLVVGPKVHATTLKEFIDEAKSSPEPLAMSSAGVGNITHGQLELFNDAANLNLLHVPYKGGAPALTDVLSGQVAGTFVGLNVALPYIKAGTLRALAIVGAKRSKTAPNIPSFAELGYPSVDCLTWMGLMAPKDTPLAISQTLAASVARAVQDKTTLAKLDANGVTPWILSSSQFQNTIRVESERWKKFVEDKKMLGE
jgi:tripartite-type tricarboxylate transporter receptor subunit TctC